MKKLLAVILAAVMLLGMLPAVALAEGDADYKFNITTNVDWGSDPESTTDPYLLARCLSNTEFDYTKDAIENDKVYMISIPNSIVMNRTITKLTLNGQELTIPELSDTVNNTTLSEVPGISAGAVLIRNWTGNNILNNKGVTLIFNKVTPTQTISISYVFSDIINQNCVPSVVVADGQATMGSITDLSFVKNTDNGSTWQLTTQTTSSVYYLDYIQIGDEETTRVESADGKTITWDVTTDGAAYTAYFAALPDAILSATLSANPAALGVSAGEWANLTVQYRLSHNVLEGKEQVFTVYKGEEAIGTPVSTYTYTGPGDTLAGENRAYVPIAAMPADVTKLTVTLSIDGGDVLTHTTEPITVKSSDSLALTHLEIPGDAPDSYIFGSYSISDGPIVFDAAVIDGNYYFATSDGIVRMDVAGTAAQMAGTDDLFFVAVGGSGDALVALGLNGERDAFGGAVYQLIDGSWSSVSGSDYDSLNIVKNSFGLVMSGSDVWTGNYHWDGSEWTANEIIFNSFWKAGATSAL